MLLYLFIQDDEVFHGVIIFSDANMVANNLQY